MTKTALVDLAERAGWTAVQAGAAYAATSLGHISTWWAVPLALALSALKTVAVQQAAKAQAPIAAEPAKEANGG